MQMERERSRNIVRKLKVRDRAFYGSYPGAASRHLRTEALLIPTRLAIADLLRPAAASPCTSST